MPLNIIYNITSIIILILFTYFSIIIIQRISVNKAYDKKLNIKTGGLRSWERGSMYNRTESTPYLALKSLASKYKLSSNDNLVDFGCGKARVAIYIHDKYKIPVTGVELNDLTYKDALENVSSYLSEQVNPGCEIRIEKHYAEKYVINECENKFFFFNPFDVSIFEKVIDNIVENAKEYNKEVEIILYYPLASYQKVLREQTSFKLVNKIRATGSIGFREKFLIYKFTP